MEFCFDNFSSYDGIFSSHSDFIFRRINLGIPLLGLIALGMGIFALRDIRKNRNLNGKGFAIATIILSALLLVIGIVSYLINTF